MKKYAVYQLGRKKTNKDVRFYYDDRWGGNVKIPHYTSGLVNANPYDTFAEAEAIANKINSRPNNLTDNKVEVVEGADLELLGHAHTLTAEYRQHQGA